MSPTLQTSLAEYRQIKRLGLAAMAKALGTTPALLSAWENGVQPVPAGFHHTVLVAFPDFFTILK